MWIKTAEGLTNLNHVKHIGLAGEGAGDIVVLYLKMDLVSMNVKIQCSSSEQAYQALKRIERMLQEREEIFDPRMMTPKLEE